MKKKPHLPWEKTLPDLSKYDWFTAVCLHPLHKNRPLELRIANGIMQHTEPETKVAWPTQRTLMKYAGVGSERQVRSAIASLCESGALNRGCISQLDEETRKKIKRSAKGKAYRLDMFWAYEVLEGSQKTKAREPEPLKIGRERHRTNIVLSDRTNVVRSTQDEGRPPNTKRNLNETGKEAFEGKQDLASTREVKTTNAYAIARREQRE